MITILKDTALLPFHTEDIWRIVHVLSALRNAPKHASLGSICLLVLMQALAPVASQLLSRALYL